MPDCGAAGDPEGRVLRVHHPALGADVVDVQARIGPGFLLNRTKAGLPNTMTGFIARDVNEKLETISTILVYLSVYLV